MNSGTIYKRLRFAGDMANGRVILAWHDWPTLSTLPLDRQVDGVVKDILGGCAEPATREAMLSTGSPAAATTAAADGQRRLRDLIAIAFASPEFQRR
jgi:hypothetical protein